MKKSSRKTILALTLILAGVGFLIMKSISDTGMYYQTVAEVLTDDSQPRQRGVRISGNVVDGTISYDQQNLLLTFAVKDMVDDSKTMLVRYNGVKPDAFKEDVEVILEGRYEKNANTFHAETLLAKCPSKYESELEEERE
ncbi:cytochrome c maturation protein CcmE [Desulfolithobacter sp.]